MSVAGHFSKQSRRERDGGFTLVELMIVVLIIAILLGIAMTTFLGARKSAQDRAAQSLLTAASKTEWIYATQDSTPDFTDNLAALTALEPSMVWGNASDDSIHVLLGDAVAVGDHRQVLLYTRSGSGTWFGLREVQAGPNAGQYRCKGAEADVNAFAVCNASAW